MKNLLSPSMNTLPQKQVRFPWVMLAVVFFSGGALAWASGQSWFPFQVTLKTIRLLSPQPSAPAPNEMSEYWAVYLDTDQVFYGKLAQGSIYDTLTDAFYYQPGVRATLQGNIRIIKVGTELHGPEDRVLVNRARIVMRQQLTSQSKVVRAIDEYHQKNGGISS